MGAALAAYQFLRDGYAAIIGHFQGTGEFSEQRISTWRMQQIHYARSADLMLSTINGGSM